MKDRILLKTNEDDLKVLTTVSEPVLLDAYSNMRDFKDQMAKIMKDSNGRGLAAPQIGYNKRILIMNTEKGEQLFMINPVIKKKSSLKIKYDEGCLSVPNKRVNKNRSRQVTVVYFDENLQEQELRLGNVDAVCLQHEIDHLDGKLI